MPYIVVENGNLRGTRIELVSGEPLVLGRDEDLGLSVEDKLCSRRHFEIVGEGDSFRLCDLGSSNGTYVNETRIEGERALENGDTIQAGETTLTFAISEATSARGLVGKTIGGYRIIERIGRGGMGTVYKASQVSLDRVVALKILSPKVAADPAFVTKFKQEAQAAGSLNHPNIVQVYDVGSDRDLHYYSMEFIENGSVQDLATREGALEFGLCMDVVSDAARGLEYAEKRGLVHRDIKPDNLMINAEGIVKIADLGLARTSGSPSTNAHEDEGIFGTPHFIAPEQAQGKTVDTRSDIYSLGASFYRLITGDTPFHGDTVREIVQAQINNDPKPVRESRRDCPAGVANIIEKMMQKDPDARPATAAELVEDLEKLQLQLEGGGKGKLIIAAAVGVIALGAIAFVVAGQSNGDPAPQPGDPGQQTQNSNQNNGQSAAEKAEFARQKRLLEFQTKLQEIRAEELSKPPRTVATIDGFLQRYQDLVEAYSDMEEAATKSADYTAPLIAKKEDIAASAARRAAEEQRLREAAEAAVTAANRDSDAAATAGRRGEAIQILLRALDSNALAGRTEASLIQAAIDKQWDAIRSQVRDAESMGATEVAGQQYAEAIRRFRTLRDALKAGVSDEDPRLVELSTIGAQLDEKIEAAQTKQRQQRERDLANDQKRFLAARKEALGTLATSFDLDQALAAYAPLEGALVTAPFQGFLAHDLAALRAAKRVPEAFVAAWQADRSPKSVDLPSSRDPGKTISWRVSEVDGNQIKLKRGSRFTREVTYASLSPSEAWTQMFSTTLAEDQAARTAMLPILLMSGDVELAQQLLPAESSQALTDQFRAERRAWQRLKNIRALEGRTASENMAWLEMLPLAEQFLEEDRASYAFSLHSDGSTPIISL